VRALEETFEREQLLLGLEGAQRSTTALSLCDGASVALSRAALFRNRPSAWGASASALEEAYGSLFQHWQAFVVGSAFFAALTAIFAKIGVSEINSDLATLIRTLVIIVVTALLVTVRREWKPPEEVSMSALVFLVLSGIGTALSWLC
jgi:hypothetical protein